MSQPLFHADHHREAQRRPATPAAVEKALEEAKADTKPAVKMQDEVWDDQDSQPLGQATGSGATPEWMRKAQAEKASDGR